VTPDVPPLGAPPPVLVVMLDGLGDRAWPELEGQTPLEAASTPNLDAIAAASATGVLHPLGPGRAPGTELAHFVLFGYRPDEYPGRVVFEATGCGLELSPADVAFRALFSTVRRLPDGSLVLVEHFADVEDRLCRAVAAELGEFECGGLAVSLTCTGARQGVLTVSGGASEDVTDCDPFFTERPIAAVRPLDNARDPMAARMTAEAVTAFLKHAYRVFREHGPSSDSESLFLVVKWVGRKRALPTFEERTGMNGVLVASGTMLAGLAGELGMGFRRCPRRPTRAPTCSGASPRRERHSRRVQPSCCSMRRQPMRPATPRTRCSSATSSPRWIADSPRSSSARASPSGPSSA
jgi:2,3-bisphosphoglycerate-independent phosphoglycerate mutase